MEIVQMWNAEAKATEALLDPWVAEVVRGTLLAVIKAIEDAYREGFKDGENSARTKRS